MTYPIRIIYDKLGDFCLIYVNDRAYTPDALCELLAWAEKEKARRHRANVRYNAKEKAARREKHHATIEP